MQIFRGISNQEELQATNWFSQENTSARSILRNTNIEL